MNKKQFAEALYALPGKNVIKGRKPFVAPLLVAVVGLVLILFGAMFEPISDQADLKLTCVSLGGVIFVAGAVVMLLRLSGRDVMPVLGRNHAPLIWTERYYAREHAAEVADCMAHRNWSRLNELQADHAAPVRLIAYRTADDSFVACQAFLYVELEERPLTDRLVADRSSAEA